jgi:hypothetical protein
MSALSSAIHNAGHYHVRPRPVCLSPSCARSANSEHSRRGSCVWLRSIWRHVTHVRSPKIRHIDCNEPAGICCRGAWSGFLSDRSLAKDRAGTARRGLPTERGQAIGDQAHADAQRAEGAIERVGPIIHTPVPQNVCQAGPQAHANRERRLPPRLPARTRPTRRSRHPRTSHHGVEERAPAHARRRFKRENGGF